MLTRGVTFGCGYTQAVTVVNECCVCDSYCSCWLTTSVKLALCVRIHDYTQLSLKKKVAKFTGPKKSYQCLSGSQKAHAVQYYGMTPDGLMFSQHAGPGNCKIWDSLLVETQQSNTHHILHVQYCINSVREDMKRVISGWRSNLHLICIDAQFINTPKIHVHGLSEDRACCWV